MKKRLVTLLAGLLTVLSMGFGLAQFSDVPAGHWAKEAVEALAAKGIILGFPDGTFRGNENLTRYQAALLIYRLLQQIEEELKTQGTSPTMEALAPEDLEALKNAVQELAAELASLGVRVSALEDSAATKEDIARLEAMIAELKAQPMPEPGMDQAALKDLMDRVEAASIAADTALAQAQQLAERLDALAQDVEGVKGDLAGLRSQVEANADAIQALNELAVLLNQDVLSLQDRVTALEKMVSGGQELPDLEQFATKEDVAAVQEFAAALRSDLVGLSEKVSKLEGQVAELSRVQYSIKGSLTATYGFVTGTGNNFDIDRLFATPFSTGVFGSPSQVASNVILEDVDSRQLTGGSLTLDFGVKSIAPAATGVSVSEATVQTAFATAITSGGSFGASPAIRLNAATLKGTVDGQPFSVAYHRVASSFQFNDYLFVNKSDPAGQEPRQGVVATFQGTKLPLTPEVTVVLGGSNTGGIFEGAYFGIRTALKPLEGLSLALNYAAADTAAPAGNPDRSALGVDGTLKLGDFSVKGLFVTSRPATGIYFQDYFDPSVSDWVYYVQLDGKLGPLSLKANYHAVDPDYAGGVAGMSADHLAYYGGVTGRQNPAPYPDDEEGLGVELGLPVGPVDLGGYLNSYGAYPYNPGTITTEAGASAKLALFSGFSLKAAYDASWTGASYVDLATQTNADVTATLSHDGAAKDALVKDLNLTLKGTYNDLHTASPFFGLAVYGDYKFALGPLSVDKVLFRYSDPNLNVANDQTLKGGLQASLKLDGLPLKPSLTGEVAARQTGGSGGTEELKWGVGLALDEFLFPGSKLEARYGEYRASNVANFLVGATNKAFDPADDRLFSGSGGASGSVAGFNVTWSYYDFRADYGEYLTSAGDHARTFRVTYTVKF
ncbi:S-layer homology domain-containing protein [Thermus thermophilus]|uniref:Putative S-layer protein n=1 Tax=Thermus thermophilus JL-18 TaxID=798128 RepID=H9ZU26_THETH|nr:S-layer homology domain-containing protein [Thermus thermophilus]AFH39836.1 putative S-layer protein [Thermus thermophilus JL-18]